MQKEKEKIPFLGVIMNLFQVAKTIIRCIINFFISVFLYYFRQEWDQKKNFLLLFF